MSKHHDLLVAYKGGGYDGCMWEWNYAYFDVHGHFHSIFHTGRGGCATRGELEELDPSDIELTDTTDETALQKFADTEAVQNVWRCAQWFAERRLQVYLKPKCDHCQRRFDIGEGRPTDFQNVGGIVVAPQQVLCADCAFVK